MKTILLTILLVLQDTWCIPLEDDSCTVSNYDDVTTAAESCDTLVLKDIVIPAETTLKIALKDGAKLIFDGHLTHEVAEWTGDLVRITGKNVEVSGTSSEFSCIWLRVRCKVRL